METSDSFSFVIPFTESYIYRILPQQRENISGKVSLQIWLDVSTVQYDRPHRWIPLFVVARSVLQKLPQLLETDDHEEVGNRRLGWPVDAGVGYGDWSSELDQGTAAPPDVHMTLRKEGVQAAWCWF